MTDTTAKAGWRLTFASFALVLAFFVPVWFIAAALGSKFGLWGWQFGLGKMTFQWGPMLAIAAVVVAVLAIIIGLIKAPRTKPVILGLFALLIAGLGLGRLIGTGAVVEALPPGVSCWLCSRLPPLLTALPTHLVNQVHPVHPGVVGQGLQFRRRCPQIPPTTSSG